MSGARIVNTLTGWKPAPRKKRPLCKQCGEPYVKTQGDTLWEISRQKTCLHCQRNTFNN